MAFEGNFSVSQTADVESFVITDTSTGTDVNLTTRRIYLQKFDETYLVPSGTLTDYIEWPYSDGSSKTLEVLEKDYSLLILVEWVSTAPDPSGEYEKEALYTFTGHSENFYYGLTQLQTAKPSLVNDNVYYSNKGQLRTEIDSANQATSYNDQYGAQSALDRAKQMIDNESYYF